MDTMTEEILKTLAQGCDETCVSIFLPTKPAGLGIREDSVRLKNLLDSAEDQMRERGVRTPDAAAILEPGRRLADDFLFWQHQGDGLALFLSKGMSRIYRLPIRFEEEARVGRSFHVKPLVPLLTGAEHFYILALTLKKVRFLRATRDTAAEIELPDVPPTLEAFLHDEDHDLELQFHTTGQGMQKQQAPREAVFHGSSSDTRSVDDEKEHWFRTIDRAIVGMIRDEKAPLVLAAAEDTASVYRRANHYGYIAEQGVTENPTLFGDDQLRESAWAVVAPGFDKARRDAADRFGQHSGTGHASADISDIVPAAAYGRVDSLLLGGDARAWGRFDAETGAVDVHAEQQPADEDLVELATAYTLLNDGQVYWLPDEAMPEGAHAAAVFRYALSESVPTRS